MQCANLSMCPGYLGWVGACGSKSPRKGHPISGYWCGFGGIRIYRNTDINLAFLPSMQVIRRPGREEASQLLGGTGQSFFFPKRLLASEFLSWLTSHEGKHLCSDTATSVQ